jgi:LacI family transcriptional regulator
MASGGRITLSEIARRADTSTMAVSVVLNGARSNTRVSDATRRRIEKIAAELNYTPNAMARGLKRQRTNTLGVLFTWAGAHTIHNMYSVAVLDGIVAGAESAGYHILLYTKRWKSAAESSAVFADQRADGVIVVAPREASDVISGLAALNLPTAIVSSTTAVPGVPFVDIDNRAGIALALEHLHGLGHTRIAYAGHGLDRHSMRERHEAFRAGMAAHGLTVPESFILSSVPAGGGGVPVLQELLRLPQPPTALVAANDDLAAEALEAARLVGLSVPEQLSVVGFDDILVASLTTPKLTTVRQPLFEMGEQAARLLVEIIEGRGEGIAQISNIFAPELIVRDSTAVPSAIR